MIPLNLLYFMLTLDRVIESMQYQYMKQQLHLKKILNYFR